MTTSTNHWLNTIDIVLYFNEKESNKMSGSNANP